MRHRTEPAEPPGKAIPETSDVGSQSKPATSRRLARWTALALVVGVVALLGLGWAADTLAQVIPAGRSTVGAGGAQTQAVGFDTLTLRVAPAPPRAGDAETLTFTLTDATGAPVSHAHIQVALTMAAMGMSGGAGLAQPTPTPGVYRLVGGFAMSGEWTLALAVTPPGQPTLHTTFTLAVR